MTKQKQNQKLQNEKKIEEEQLQNNICSSKETKDTSNAQKSNVIEGVKGGICEVECQENDALSHKEKCEDTTNDEILETAMHDQKKSTFKIEKSDSISSKDVKDCEPRNKEERNILKEDDDNKIVNDNPPKKLKLPDGIESSKPVQEESKITSKGDDESIIKNLEPEEQVNPSTNKNVTLKNTSTVIDGEEIVKNAPTINGRPEDEIINKQKESKTDFNPSKKSDKDKNNVILVESTKDNQSYPNTSQSTNDIEPLKKEDAEPDELKDKTSAVKEPKDDLKSAESVLPKEKLEGRVNSDVCKPIEQSDLVNSKESIFSPKCTFNLNKLKSGGNIFSKEEGKPKTKKESAFLHTTLNSTVEKCPENTTHKNKGGLIHPFRAALSYYEDNEWLDVGSGEILIKDGNFIFVRDMLKTVILNFPKKSTEFKEEDGVLYFKTKVKRPNEKSIEEFEREYKFSLENSDKVESILKSLKE